MEVQEIKPEKERSAHFKSFIAELVEKFLAYTDHLFWKANNPE